MDWKETSFQEFPTGRLVRELIARKSVTVLQAKSMAVIGLDSVFQQEGSTINQPRSGIVDSSISRHPAERTDLCSTPPGRGPSRPR
jgi:hypothetical protein